MTLNLALWKESGSEGCALQGVTAGDQHPGKHQKCPRRHLSFRSQGGLHPTGEVRGTALHLSCVDPAPDLLLTAQRHYGPTLSPFFYFPILSFCFRPSLSHSFT